MNRRGFLGLLLGLLPGIGLLKALPSRITAPMIPVAGSQVNVLGDVWSYNVGTRIWSRAAPDEWAGVTGCDRVAFDPTRRRLYVLVSPTGQGETA